MGGPHRAVLQGRETLGGERSWCRAEARGISPGNTGKTSFMYMSPMWDPVGPTWAELSEVQAVLGIKNFIELRWERGHLINLSKLFRNFRSSVLLFGCYFCFKEGANGVMQCV